MDHVRVTHAPIAPVPTPAPLEQELSKEDRLHLRVARHQAFQRHQQNAAWALELLGGQAPPALQTAKHGGERRAFAARFRGLSREAVAQRLAAQEEELAALKIEIERAEQQRERAERGSDGAMAALKRLNEPEAIAAARERLLIEREALTDPVDRKVELVRL